MPVPSNISDLSQTPGSNSPAGSESPALLDDYHRTTFAFIAKLRDGQGLSNPVDLASAATTDIGAQTSPVVRITGTTTITSFGTNYAGPRFLVFGGALTLTHNATSLILPGGANITTAAGDCAIAVPNLATPTGWRVIFISGAPAATDSTKGLVELATDAEAQAGTAADKAVTAGNLGATVLGIGQTWQAVTRAVNTTYTNSTGRPIMLSIALTSGVTESPTVLIDGVTHGRIGVVAGVVGSGWFVIPDGSTYRVNATTATVNTWSELR